MSGPPPRRPRPSRRDDPAARERARETLHRELDRGADPEVAALAALDVSSECVEALLVLADCATSLPQARDRIRRAVETSTLVLGERGLREGRGRLGDDPDGLDHLHALAALARVQTAEDRAEQAVQTLHGVLDLDPTDPAAVRGGLLLLLLALARDEEADELVARHPAEADADWLYGRALVRRRRATDEASLARATEALDRALAAFPAAGDALGGEPAPGRGSRPALDPLLVQAFEDTEGAIAWARARLAVRRPTVEAPKPVRDPRADRRFSAQEHVEEAREAHGSRRIELARRALELWPDAADAWRVLAGEAATPGARADALLEAVAAATRALGRDPTAAASAAPDDEDGLRLRRARHDLVLALLDAGRAADAEAHAGRLLVEDPEDVTKGAVEHAVRLLVAGRDAEATPLVDAHAEEASPDWSWLAVLLARRAGDRIRASFALGEAALTAPRVGEVLRHGAMRARRDEDVAEEAWREALAVAGRIRPAFEATPGALEWLRSQRPPPKTSSRAAPG